MNEFEHFIIKPYKYWNVQIHENQGYLGRTILWCRRENAKDLSEVTPEEYEEFLIVLRMLKTVLETLFHPDWFNYAFLGNVSPHLHCHVIPRYASSREFAGQIFKDELWGKNYQTDPEFVTSEELLEKVKIAIGEKLE